MKVFLFFTIKLGKHDGGGGRRTQRAQYVARHPAVTPHGILARRGWVLPRLRVDGRGSVLGCEGGENGGVEQLLRGHLNSLGLCRGLNPQY